MEDDIMRPKKEKDVQKEILEFLRSINIFHWRVPLGGVAQKGGKFYTKNPMSGHPDIACLLNGTYLAIEVKGIGQRANLSSSQWDWRKAINDNGGVSIVVTSVCEVRDAILSIKNCDQEGIQSCKGL